MKKLLLLLIIPFLSFWQNKLLDSKNGFKDIKLGSDIRDYSFVRKCVDSDLTIELGAYEFGGQKYVRHHYKLFHWDVDYIVSEDAEDYKMIHGTIMATPIKVFIKTHEFKIYEIIIIADELNYGRNATPIIFHEVFGQPNKIYGGNYWEKTRYHDSWYGENITLTLTSIPHGNDADHIGYKCTYRDLNIFKKVYEEKEKVKEDKLQKIKDQF